MTIVGDLEEEIGGTIKQSYFLDDEVDDARTKSIRKFEEDMTDMPIEWEDHCVLLRQLQITRYSRFDS